MHRFLTVQSLTTPSIRIACVRVTLCMCMHTGLVFMWQSAPECATNLILAAACTLLVALRPTAPYWSLCRLSVNLAHGRETSWVACMLIRWKMPASCTVVCALSWLHALTPTLCWLCLTSLWTHLLSFAAEQACGLLAGGCRHSYQKQEEEGLSNAQAILNRR